MPTQITEYPTTLHGTIRAADITPDDNAAIECTRAIFVGTGGDLAVDLVRGGTVIYKNLSDGTRLVIHAVKVYATDTTAADLIAEY